MAKNKEDWTCGDCGAVLSHKVKFCNAPNHELHADLFRARARIRQLEGRIEQSKTNWYMSRERFLREYTGALENYMSQSFKSEGRYHPYDLACAVATFNEAFYAIMDNMEFRPTE